MTVRQIVHYEREGAALSGRSAPLTVFGAPLEQLVADLVDTMRHAGGVGLAAVQIGIPLRVFIIETENFGYQAYVNPRLLTHSARLMGFEEGCLSCPNDTLGVVVRPHAIEAVWQNTAGKRCVGRLTGMRARIFLHELDHLNGTLYIERVQPGDFVVGDEPRELRQ
jgi:peptide deformylase